LNKSKVDIQYKFNFLTFKGDSQILLRPHQFKYGFSSNDGVIIFQENNKKSGFGYSYGYKALSLFRLNHTIHESLHNGFHIFFVEWDKTGIKFLIDDQMNHYFKFDEKLYRSDELGTYEKVGQPFDHNFNIYFQSYPTLITVPDQIYSQIDYVKVYKWLQTSSEDDQNKSNTNPVFLSLTIILSVI